MTRHKWNYCGDVSLSYGGYFWREDGADDYVLVVRVQPCSDAGGPDNLFWIEEGSLYMPDDENERRRALACCGWDKEEKPSRDMLVDALIAYRSFDIDNSIVLRIGPQQEARAEWGEQQVGKVLRSNASLKNYVKANYLDRS